MEGVKLTWWQRHRLGEQLKGTQDAHLYRRTLALLEASRGQSIAQVAATLGVTRQSVYNWIASYVPAHDLHALQDKPRSGRPSFWTEDHQAVLRWLMDHTPDEFGYFAGDWTVPLLQEQWKHGTGLRLSPEIVRRGLQEVGYVWKRGRYELEPDPELEKKTPYSGSDSSFAAPQRAAGGGRDRSVAVSSFAGRLGAARTAPGGADLGTECAACGVRSDESVYGTPLVPGS